MSLLHPSVVTLAEANETLLGIGHYLGPSARGQWCWLDEDGVMIWNTPMSRRLPSRFLELSRWCLRGRPNGGSSQWARWLRFAKGALPHITTFVSYSDPSVGHTGALYRACNWQWAPTWHRLRPPPSGNGAWAVKRESVKDRWTFPLRPDEARAGILSVKDDSLTRLGVPTYREFVARGAA